VADDAVEAALDDRLARLHLDRPRQEDVLAHHLRIERVADDKDDGCRPGDAAIECGPPEAASEACGDERGKERDGACRHDQALLALALVYWIVDVRGWKRWGFFFKVIGVNPLTIYLLSWTVLKWEYEKEYFFGELMRSYPGPVMNCIAEWGTIGLFWLLLYYMYRRQIFLKV
jgi:hypothetical protein